MKYPVHVLVLLFCLVAPVRQAAADQPNDDLSRRIYQFEHRLMPNWVHNSDGQFFADLIDNQGNNAREIAAKLVSPEFAQQMRIETIVPDKAVLISFPEPQRTLLCYQAIIAKTDTGYAYYTLEKADDILKTGDVKAMYCSWISGTTRRNFGSRDYTDAESFKTEYLATPNPANTPITTQMPNRTPR